MFAVSANGVKGCLIYDHVAGTFVFRVYDKRFNFVDCPISHNDLTVVIKDADAYFYMLDDGTVTLDHAPATVDSEIKVLQKTKT